MKLVALASMAFALLLGLGGLWILVDSDAPLRSGEEQAFGRSSAGAPTVESASGWAPLRPVEKEAGSSRRPLDASSPDGTATIDPVFEKSPARPEPGALEGPLAELFYDDGTLCFEAQQVRDESGSWVLDGRWTAWHENGVMQEQGAYEMHRETGRWQWWDDNGERIAVGDFDGGKREGKWIFWYTDGIRQLDAQYSGGKAIGFWTLYFEDGSKCAEGEYVDGEISGHWTVWDEFGAVNPERTGFYENGQKISE
jgi:antitoxin component YwqK of YwqJK toxin-antitoxin module